MIGRPKFVLASGSPRRLSLVNQVGIEPDALRPTDIDETPKRGELPRACATRLAREKAEAALAMVRIDDDLKGAYILAADTVVAVGRRILPKAELLDEAAQCLRLLSGRNHRVHTAVCLVTPKETFRQRYVETRVRFKRLSDEDIEAYLASGEWRGKAGGYAAQGIAGSFHGQDRRLLFQRRRPAALRDDDSARRRGLSDPFRLAQHHADVGAQRHAPHIAVMTDAKKRGNMPDLRQAGRRIVPPVLLANAAPTSTCTAGFPASMRFR